MAIIKKPIHKTLFYLSSLLGLVLALITEIFLGTSQYNLSQLKNKAESVFGLSGVIHLARADVPALYIPWDYPYSGFDSGNGNGNGVAAEAGSIEGNCACDCCSAAAVGGGCACDCCVSGAADADAGAGACSCDCCVDGGGGDCGCDCCQ